MTDRWHAHPSDQTGFTLIELLVCLVILGLLAGLAIPQIAKILDKGRWDSMGPQISLLETALDRYYLDNGNYPDSLEDLVRQPPDVTFWTGPYLKPEKLTGPWGHAVVYTMPGEYGDFDLLMVAKDGRPGGEGFAADLSNHEGLERLARR